MIADEKDNRYHKMHVPESFNVHLGTLQMISIVYAFIFAALVTFLTNGPLISEASGLGDAHVTKISYQIASIAGSLTLNYLMIVTVYLVVATMSLLTAMIAFHATLINVYAQWKIYFPHNWIRSFAGVLMTVGVFSTALAIIALLAWREFYGLVVLSALFVITWIPILGDMASKVRALGRVTDHMQSAEQLDDISRAKAPSARSTRVEARPDMVGDYDDIAARAYHLWENAGRPSGRDLEFWFLATNEPAKCLTGALFTNW